MAQYTRNLRIIAAVVATGVVGALGTGALADVTVKGDQAAWGEIAGAFEKLNALSGYRMKSSEEGQIIVFEIVPSQRASHIVAENQFGGMEIIIVGSDSRFRTKVRGVPTAWQCQAVPQNARPTDPMSIEGIVEVARGKDTTIDGTPVRTYAYTTTRDNFTRRTTLYVEMPTGLPRRTVTGVDSGGIAVGQTIDFYDFGAQISITLPSCG